MKLHLVTANAMELCKLISGKSEEDEQNLLEIGRKASQVYSF